MRYINDIIVHCTDTPEGREVTVSDVDRWHREKGWAGCGYHYLVRLDGTVERGRAISRPGAHCKNHNAHSIGVCYAGGRDTNGDAADTRTKEQKAALLKLVTNLIFKYRANVHGHNDYARKDCPCFDVTAEYGKIYERMMHYKTTKN